MRNGIIILVVVALLSLSLAGAAFAGYRGMGLISTDPNARSGSTGGVVILGGGPGSGK